MRGAEESGLRCLAGRRRGAGAGADGSPADRSGGSRCDDAEHGRLRVHAHTARGRVRDARADGDGEGVQAGQAAGLPCRDGRLHGQADRRGRDALAHFGAFAPFEKRKRAPAADRLDDAGLQRFSGDRGRQDAPAHAQGVPAFVQVPFLPAQNVHQAAAAR